MAAYVQRLGLEVGMRYQAIVITNNPSVSLEQGDTYVEGALLDVLLKARDLIHKGHLLVSHPLAGSVKPNETPYKSIVLSKRPRPQVDFESLSIIEGSLATARRMLQERPLPDYPQRVLQDFQLIDRSLLANALSGLPGYLN
jgi:hypothetical protein